MSANSSPVSPVQQRELVFESLVAELVGPSNSTDARPLDPKIQNIFTERKDVLPPYRVMDSNEEILTGLSPILRYGVGILHPTELATTHSINETELEAIEVGTAGPEVGIRNGQGDLDVDDSESALTDEAFNELEKSQKRVSREAQIESDETQIQTGANAADIDVNLFSSNSSKPSSIGLSFLAELQENCSATISIRGGRYRKFKVQVGGRLQDWWYREKVQKDVSLGPVELLIKPSFSVLIEPSPGLILELKIYSRKLKNSNAERLITVCFINRSKVDSPAENSLFQTEWSIEAKNFIKIRPYPGPDVATMSEEDASTELIYHRFATFAVGHGCSADWNSSDQPTILYARSMPKALVKGLTPNIRRSDGSVLTVSMNDLTKLDSKASASLQEVVDAYSRWITTQENEISSLPLNLQTVAKKNMAKCRDAMARIQGGITFLLDPKNQKERRAFELANSAMFLQQSRGGLTRRQLIISRGSGKTLSAPYPDVDFTGGGVQPNWRPFQIAFILMAVESTSKNSADRNIAELIFFPTGGGKTEAYLGLAAYSIALRRLRNSSDTGLDVLMRYTLRLLTAQQFERSSRMICALEYLRRSNPELGTREISIGLWVGESVTPNSRAKAVSMLRRFKRGEEKENPFVVTECPWCRLDIGPQKANGPKEKYTPGYQENNGTVQFKCADEACDFSARLPVVVIDEDIYRAPPSMLIGTIDKFASLAWREEIRSIFGLGDNGERIVSPPNLIIQDELHLISGPLGSMAGLFEVVIDELCTDRTQDPPRLPKIISSTATVKRYREQIKSLYNRADAKLFPPAGLDSGDSFFAQEDTSAPGRLYVGVYPSSFSSIQTAQVRTFSALLQSSTSIDPASRDAWWTLMLFFNSIRELGTTLSLLQSDIPEYVKVMWRREGFTKARKRYIRKVLELTGRLKNAEVPEAITKLQVSLKQNRQPKEELPVDVCLASNIIEVGIDIARLGLLCVVGQPKSTAQYIQVTGRVGRDAKAPGLVVTLYSATKSRDCSHFEKFKSYHERMYSYVEPTSVTPFARPVLDRALHAVITAYIRQTGAKDTAPVDVADRLWDEIEQLLRARVTAIDKTELLELDRVMAERRREFKGWACQVWTMKVPAGPNGLIYSAGSYLPDSKKDRAWATPQSLRDVDAQCQIEICKAYEESELQDGN